MATHLPTAAIDINTAEAGDRVRVQYWGRTPNRDRKDVSKKTRGEIEAAICEGITRFEQEHIGRGPKQIRTHLIGDIILIRLTDTLSQTERQLARLVSPSQSSGPIKQVRTALFEASSPSLQAMIGDIVGVDVLCMHHDLSIDTGEEVILFTLAQAVEFRDPKQRS